MREIGIGHNQGPSMDALRIRVWARARAALPQPAPAVARLWLSRAAALGMPAADYFAFRGAAGRDLAAVILTQPALAPGTGRWPARRARLAALNGVRLGLLVHRAVDTAALDGLPVTLAPLPGPATPWSERRAAIRDLLARMQAPAAGTLLVADGPSDLMTMQAGGLADLWSPARFFTEPDPLTEPLPRVTGT